MMGKKTMIFLVCLAVLACPAVADAMRNSPPGRWWHMPDVAAALELSQAEKEALDTLYVQNRRNLIDVKNELDKERFELENILEQQNLNEQAAIEQLREIARQRGQLSMERFRYPLEVRQLLGPEPPLKLVNLAKEVHGERGPGQNDPLEPR